MGVVYPLWMDERKMSSFVFLQVEEALKQLRSGVRQPHCGKVEVMIDLVVEIPFWGW